jgi:hypothetical protein
MTPSFALNSRSKISLIAACSVFVCFALSARGAGAPLESLGQCSRRTSLVISEIMYHPANSDLEYVEFFNSREEPQDMSGYRLDGDIQYTCPSGTVIAGRSFLVIARAPGALSAAYGISAVLGPYINNLSHKSGTVRLLNQAGGVLLEVSYGTTPPWPISPDGTGHSLVLARPSYGENNVLAWAASDSVGGSPGKEEPMTPEPLRQVVINELAAHPNPSSDSFVELYNTSNQPLDLSGCSLSDDPQQSKFLIPSPTVIPARGFQVWNASQLGFVLKPGGGSIFFRNAEGTRVLDAVRYEGQQQGTSFGRIPDGAPIFRLLASPSPNQPNGPVLVPDVVINEIMYAPISLNDDDQYVELYNRSPNPIDVGGWKFTSGISFTFPEPTVLPVDGYLVLARNASRLGTLYPNLNSTNLAGDFAGTLSHKGERLTLTKPELAQVANGSGGFTTNAIDAVENELIYGTGGRWGEWSDAGGSSLELINPDADNALAPNWADSDETHKAPWTIVSATGTIDNGDVAANQLQVLLEGAGECLIDDVQVLDPNGNNLVANPSFEPDAGGWTAEGTEKTSSLETTEAVLWFVKCFFIRVIHRDLKRQLR